MSKLRFYKGSSDYVEVQPPVGAGTSTVTLPSSTGTLTTSSEVYTLQGSSPSNRNLLYNGAMQVSQRGTSVTSNTTGGYLTADRWYTEISSLGTWTQDIQNDAPTGSGFRRSVRFLCTTADVSPAAGDYMVFQQRLEGQDVQRIRKGTSSAQKLTLSFWVKSNVTGTYVAELYDNDNTRSVSVSYTISASATWERKTITFPADTTNVLDNDNAASLVMLFWLGAGSNFTGGSPLQTAWGTATNTRATGQTNLGSATNNYWQVTGVQLETGDVATDFEFKSYGQELRECQRYYWRLTSLLNNEFPMSGYQWNGTTSYGQIIFPTPMRAAPTFSFEGTVGNFQTMQGTTGNTAVTALTQATASTQYSVLSISMASGGSRGYVGTLLAANAANILVFSSEL